MSKAVLTIASKNYGSWSLRGWLLCKMAGIDFEEQHIGTDDPSTRAELLLLSPSFLVPRLTHDGLKVWDTLAIAEYLHRALSRGGSVAFRPRAARPLPLDLRGDAFRLQQFAIGAADEHQGALPGISNRGPARMAISIASPPSGASASKPTADLICSAKRPALPTPCTRRCARASSPTTWPSIRYPRNTAERSWRCRSCWNGSPRPKSSRTNWKSSTSNSRSG